MAEPRGFVDRLPSPGGFALWLYALVFVFAPLFLAYKGFAYIFGVVIFAIGLRPHVVALAQGRGFNFGMRWRGEERQKTFKPGFASEKSVVRTLSILLVTFTLLVVPFLAYILQYQALVFYKQLNTQLPTIIAKLTIFFDAAHDKLPNIIPDVDSVQGTGWEGLSSLLNQVAGDAIADLKIGLKKMSSNIVALIGGLLGDWVKLVIGAIIVGTILGSWDKEVKMHRAIISGGIRDKQLRANVLRYGELYQDGVSLFLIGYLEVAVTLSLLYMLAMIVLPLGLGIGAILFMGLVLGFSTAIPKIGGIFAMGISFLLMATNIDPGLGWFGWQVVSFGVVADVIIRTGLLMAVSKLMGLLEAYSYTPDIIGARLGMTKMQIIATIIIWAVGAGFFGMIWGIWISLSFQAALRLAQERGDIVDVNAVAADKDAA